MLGSLASTLLTRRVSGDCSKRRRRGPVAGWKKVTALSDWEDLGNDLSPAMNLFYPLQRKGGGSRISTILGHVVDSTKFMLPATNCDCYFYLKPTYYYACLHGLQVLSGQPNLRSDHNRP